MQTQLSTQEVATLLNVTETTIKRWADEGKIQCVKTPGRHRKFLLSDLIRFAEEHSFPVTGLAPLPLELKQMEELKVAVATRNFDVIASLLLEEARQADRKGLVLLMKYLYQHQIPFSAMVDDVVRPALSRVGTLWTEGKLEVREEHQISNSILEALIHLSPQLHQRPSNGLTALCACPEGEDHEIGIRTVAMALELEGWKVQYLGADTPFADLHSAVASMNPNLVCLSLTIPEHSAEVLQKTQSLGKRIHQQGGQFIAGGLFSSSYSADDLGCDTVAQSIHDVIQFTRKSFQLRPGPKTNHSTIKHS